MRAAGDYRARRSRPSARSTTRASNAVTQSDVLERFKKEKVGLSVESQYDPTKIKRAETVLKQLLAEHGHQFATIKTEVKTIPPASVAMTFTVKEGPTVKVGKIALRRQQQRQRPDAARGDGESEADRDTALDHS